MMKADKSLGALVGGDAVNRVEASNVEAQISQADAMQEIEKRYDLLHAVSLNRTVYHLGPWVGDADLPYDPAPFVVLKRCDPISDLGIKVGCIVTAAELRFHAAVSIVKEGVFLRFLKNPAKVWRYAVISAPAIVRHKAAKA